MVEKPVNSFILLMQLSLPPRLKQASLGDFTVSFFSAQLHSVTIDEETQTPVPSIERKVPLNLRVHPVAATFVIFDE